MKKFECMTPGCHNVQRFGDLCASCTTKQRHQKAPKEIRSVVRPTGETRWAEGHSQVEMTDGRQTWWVGATEEAA